MGDIKVLANETLNGSCPDCYCERNSLASRDYTILLTSGSPFGLWINPILLTSGSPFALWINPIHVLLTGGSPFALWISLILLTSGSLFGLWMSTERLSFWALV